MGVLFFVNLDKLTSPTDNGTFLELKTRTWSLSDAENKANFIHEMMDSLGIDISEAVSDDYLDFATKS